MAARKEILLIEVSEKGARVVKRNINDIGGAAENAQSSVDDLKKLLGGLISAKLLKDTVMLADTYANLMNRIRVVTDSNYELQKAMEGVYNMTIDTRTSLEANVDLFARVKLNTDKMGLSMVEVLEFATSLNHAVILSGVTAREAQWGMVQFSQALAAGALRGDELRAVMEQLPVVTKVIAKHMGVTRGELRLLAFQGRVTSKVMIDAFSKTKGAANELAELFLKRIPTIDQGLTALRSAWIRFIGEQDQATEGTANLAKGLMFISKNMDILGRFAEIAALVIGGVLISNVLKLESVLKVFNFTLLRTHWLMGTFAIAAISFAVFSDKIKVSDVGMASLADTVAAFVPEIMAAAESMGNFIAAAAGSSKKLDLDTTFEDLLMNAAKFSDKFVGVFTSIYAVMKNSFNNQFNFVVRLVLNMGAYFKALGATVRRTFGLLSTIATSTAKGIKATLTKDLGAAKIYADQVKAAGAALKSVSVRDFIEEPDLSLFQDSGKNAWDAFKEGWMGRGTQSEDMMTRVLKRAQDKARGKAEGTESEVGDGAGALTPVESTLFKKLTGDLEGLRAKASTLKDLFFKDVYGSILQANIALKDGSMSAQDHGVAMTALTRKAMFFADSQDELDMLMKKGLITEFQYSLALGDIKVEMTKLGEATKHTGLTMEVFNRSMLQTNIAALEAATDASSGFQRGLAKMGLEITDFASIAEKTVTNAFNGMEDALVSFVTTGKVDFKGMVDSILGDLTRLLFRMMLVKAFEGSAGKGGIMGSLADVVLSGKASGGHMMPGGAYRVGDDGPEIVQMGNSAGNVVNARDTANMAAGPAGPAQAQQPLTIINLWADDDIGAYLEDDNKGGRIIVNKSPGRGRGQAQ